MWCIAAVLQLYCDHTVLQIVIKAFVRCFLANNQTIIPPRHLLFFRPFPPQVTLPWALVFAVLGVLCRIPGVLYQSSKAGVACRRVMAHVCLVQVGERGGSEGGGAGGRGALNDPHVLDAGGRAGWRAEGCIHQRLA